ncbi:DUF2809 domain-containing protein [Cellulomonas sp. McL0617]|uniref:DUF2809 domain-containing protein n=1 Tax=Cellulomonas sp. McL0617 TaxID=3415675 RepID=UPI003CF0F159
MGDALYAVLVYVLVVGVVPRVRVTRAAPVALGICVAVELFQLTGLPATIVATRPSARYVLGTTFHAPDLLAYAVGVALAAGLDLAIARLRDRGTRRRRTTDVSPSASGRTAG